MAKNTWRKDTLARDLRAACDDMRRWMQLDPSDLAQMDANALLAMADVAMRVYDAANLVVDERRARERADAQVLDTLKQIAQIGGTVDVRA
jgi:hypothetical protein